MVLGGKMKDLIITICADTRKVKFNRDFIGISGENLQGKIIVEFSNKADFQNGEARFEVEQKGKKYIINMTLNNIDKTYELPILSSLLSYSCDLKCQITITSQNSDGGNGVPVFKSEIFLLPCREAVNATESIPEQYPSWITTANAKISEMNSLMKELEEKLANGDFNGQTGATGPKGDKGEGVPTGGTIGQVLRKKSNEDYDFEWGAGGTGGDTIIKDVTPIENSNSWQIAKTDRNALEDAFEKGDTCYVRICENAYRKYLLRGISYPGKTGGFMMFLGSGYKKTDDNNDWSVIYVATITTSGSSSSEGDYQGVSVFALSENYELLRYIPITRRNLSTAGANAYSGYYIHTGATTEAYECGKIYYKDGDFWAIDGDYNSLNNKTIINQSLSAEGFTPVANTYYRHTGATTEAYTKGVIYYYNGSEYKRIDGKGTTDYNAFANKPIYNADLSNLSNPTAYTYYRHTGETTDKFEKGCIYYRDAMGYVKINNAPFVLPLQKDANGNLQVQTSKLKQALEAFSQGSIVYLREFFYSSQEDTTPYGAANYMAVRVSGSYASGEINNNRITFVDFIGDGCTMYVINSASGDYANVIKNTYKFIECPEGYTNEDDVYTVTLMEGNTPYLGWRPKHNPVITGGGLAKLYFDKTQTPDLSGFEYTYDESMQMDASSIISNSKMALVAVRFGDAGNYVYGLVYIDANDNPNILYVSSDFVYNGVNLSAGWQTFDNPITLNGVAIANDSISTVSGWNGVWVGREPFYATREYAKSATILASPNGTKYRIKVADDGTLSTEAVTA